MQKFIIVFLLIFFVENNAYAKDIEESCINISKLFTFINDFFDLIWQFLNTSFFLTIAGTFSAAIAGAYGAQKISEKTKNKEYQLTEIKNTNATTMIAFNICIVCLSLKKDHVKPLKDNYDQQLKDYQKATKGFVLEADFKSISPLMLPLDLLQKQVFEKIPSNSKVLIITTTLTNAIQLLNDSIETRNDLIKTYKKNSPIECDKLINLYFGCPDKHGNIDQHYPDTIDSIHRLTDDCIFFSNLLCKELYKHGSIHKKEYGKNAPYINNPDFTKAEKHNLMPNSENYNNWNDMFIRSS